MIRDLSHAFNVAVLIVAIATAAAWSYLESRARLSDRPAPQDWAQSAQPDDFLQVSGRTITYWGNPDARYSVYATKRKKKPRAIVVHYTSAKPVLDLVAYGHVRDFNRGGHSYGYHFYIGRGGGIAQGAPLGKRTNHIKSIARRQRTKTARHLWSGNTIGISLVGGCDALLSPNWRRWSACSREYLTEAQLRAGLVVIRALQKRFAIACAEVYGHGELQTDRARFEGATLTRRARDGCGGEAGSS